MKPVYISFENLKCCDGQYDLKPINVFTGTNGIGKSAVLWAVELALQGYHRKLGKHNYRTAVLMSESRMEMNVCLRFEGDKSNQFTLKRKPGGDFSKSKQFDIDDIPEFMFDLRSYLGEEKKDRIKIITDRIGQSDITLDETALLETLGKIEVIPAAECAIAVKLLIEFTTKSIASRKKTKQSIQDWLATLVSSLEDEKKRFATLKNQASAQMVGLRPSGPTPKSAEAQLKELTSKREAIEKRLSALRTLQQQISTTSQRRAQLQAIVDAVIPDVSKQEEFAAELRTELTRYEPNLDAIQTKLKEKIQLANSKKSEMQKKEQEIAALVTKILELPDLDRCPHCRSRRKDWKAEAAKEWESEKLELDQQYLRLSDEYEAIKNEGVELRKLEEAAKKTSMDHDAKKDRIAKLEAEISEAARLKNAKGQAQAELNGMTAAAGTVDPLELEKLQIELDAINQSIIPVEAAETAYKAFLANREKSNTTEKTLLENQTREEVFKKAVSTVTKEQEKLVGSAFDKILEHAKKFTDGILPGPLVYRDGDLGMNTDAGFVAHEVMGTTHQTIAYIGVSIALAQQSPTKIVLLDEAGIIHPDIKPLVVQRLLDLCKDKTIDAVFMTDPTDIGYAGFAANPDFQLVRLE